MNVVGYITKYMTKDIEIDYGEKYLCSMNLRQPKTAYIDSDRVNEYSKLFLVENLYDIKFENSYYDIFNEEIKFTEYKV